MRIWKWIDRLTDYDDLGCFVLIFVALVALALTGGHCSIEITSTPTVPTPKEPERDQ